MGPLDYLAKERGRIAEAPVAFFFSFLAMAILIGSGFYAFFKEDLSRKDEVIKDKNEYIDTLKGQLEAAKKAGPLPVQSRTRMSVPSKPSRVSGAAETDGANSPANTGDGNTFNNEIKPEIGQPK